MQKDIPPQKEAENLMLQHKDHSSPNQHCNKSVLLNEKRFYPTFLITGCQVINKLQRLDVEINHYAF
jgi:hypothetical protein